MAQNPVRAGRRDGRECRRNPSATFMARRTQARRAAVVSDDNVRDGPGAMLLVTRGLQDGFAARFLCRAGFIDFQGARDPAISRRLTAAFARDRGATVKSLRRDSHTDDETCWLHGDGWCLSRRESDGQ